MTHWVHWTETPSGNQKKAMAYPSDTNMDGNYTPFDARVDTMSPALMEYFGIVLVPDVVDPVSMIIAGLEEGRDLEDLGEELDLERREIIRLMEDSGLDPPVPDFDHCGPAVFIGTPVLANEVAEQQGWEWYGVYEGWLFCQDDATRYWVAGSGNWSDNTNHWSAASGGAPGASKPGVSDLGRIDANSGAATFTITLDENVNINNYNTSGANAHILNMVTYDWITATYGYFHGNCTVNAGTGTHQFGGSTYTSDWGLYVDVFNGDTSSISASSVNIPATSTLTSTSNTLTVTSHFSSDGWINQGGVFDSNGGEVAFDLASASAVTSYFNTAGDSFNDFSMNCVNASSYVRADNSDVAITGDMTITKGYYCSLDDDGVTTRDLDVDGDGYIAATGVLAVHYANPTVVNFGSITVVSGGIVNSTPGTMTIDNETAGGKAIDFQAGSVFTHNDGELKVDTNAATTLTFGQTGNLYDLTIDTIAFSDTTVWGGSADLQVENDLEIIVGWFYPSSATSTMTVGNGVIVGDAFWASGRTGALSFGYLQTAAATRYYGTSGDTTITSNDGVGAYPYSIYLDAAMTLFTHQNCEIIITGGGNQRYESGGETLYDLTINYGGAGTVYYDNVDNPVDNDIIVTDGSLAPYNGGESLTIGGNISNAVGTSFQTGSGKTDVAGNVLFNGTYSGLTTGELEVDGTATFNNTVALSGAMTFTFDFNNTSTVNITSGTWCQDADYTIDSEATLSVSTTFYAPNCSTGSFTTKGFVANSGIVFYHDDGEMQMDLSEGSLGGTEDPVFYDLSFNGIGSSRYFYYTKTVEHNFSSGMATWMASDAMLKMGTSSSAGAINYTAYYLAHQTGGTTIYVQAINESYPCVVTGLDWNWDAKSGGSVWNLKWLYYDIEMATGGANPTTITEAGSMKWTNLYMYGGDTYNQWSGTTEIDNESAAGYAVDMYGGGSWTTWNNNNGELKITTPATTLLKWATVAATCCPYDLTCDSSNVIQSNYGTGFEVEHSTDIITGSFRPNYGTSGLGDVTVQAAGTYNGHTYVNTFNSFVSESGSTVTFSSADTTIDGCDASSYGLWLKSGTTFSPASSLVIMDRTAGAHFLRNNSGTDLYDLQISGPTCAWVGNGGGDLSHDLTVDDGSTYYSSSGPSGYGLTVDNHTVLYGTVQPGSGILSLGSGLNSAGWAVTVDGNTGHGYLNAGSGADTFGSISVAGANATWTQSTGDTTINGRNTTAGGAFYTYLLPTITTNNSLVKFTANLGASYINCGYRNGSITPFYDLEVDSTASEHYLGKTGGYSTTIVIAHNVVVTSGVFSTWNSGEYPNVQIDGTTTVNSTMNLEQCRVDFNDQITIANGATMTDGKTVTFIDIDVQNGGTLSIDASVASGQSVALTWTADDVAGVGFMASAGQMTTKGDATYGVTITSAGAPPTNAIDMDTSLDITADYTTFSYTGTVASSNQTWDIDHCIFNSGYNGATGVGVYATTLTSFTYNTINGYGTGSSFYLNATKTGLDHIIITVNGSGTSVGIYDGARVEFTNSTFDPDNCNCYTTGIVFSYDHAAVDGDFVTVLAGNDSVAFSEAATEPDSGDNLYFYMEDGGNNGTFTFDEQPRTFGMITVQSGKTINLIWSTGTTTILGDLVNLVTLQITGTAILKADAVTAADDIEISFQSIATAAITIASGAKLWLLGSVSYRVYLYEAGRLSIAANGVVTDSGPVNGIDISAGTLEATYAHIFHMNNLVKSSTLTLTDAEYWFAGSGEQIVAATWTLVRSLVGTHSQALWWIKPTGTISLSTSLLVNLVPSIYSASYYIIFRHGSWKCTTIPRPKEMAETIFLGANGAYKEDTGYGSERVELEGRVIYDSLADWDHALDHRIFTANLMELWRDTGEVFKFTWNEGYYPIATLDEYKPEQHPGEWDEVSSRTWKVTISERPYN